MVQVDAFELQIESPIVERSVPQARAAPDHENAAQRSEGAVSNLRHDEEAASQSGGALSDDLAEEIPGMPATLTGLHCIPTFTYNPGRDTVTSD